MAAITRLSLMGTPARPYGSFAAKTPGAVAGPFYAEAKQVFVPGAVEAQIWSPGAVASQIFSPGAQKSEIWAG